MLRSHLRAQEKQGMYLSESDPTQGVDTEWEVVVIGAGAVGLVAAVSLARAGVKVLLLETGAAEPGAAQDLNAVSMTGRAHSGALHGRARVVGRHDHALGGAADPVRSLRFRGARDHARGGVADIVHRGRKLLRRCGGTAGSGSRPPERREPPARLDRGGCAGIRLRILFHPVAARVQSGALVRG